MGLRSQPGHPNKVEYILSECEGNYACLVKLVRECVKPGTEEKK